MTTITQFIAVNNLKPGDALEVVCPQSGFPKHYAIYLGNRNGMPQFIANITSGVQILSREKLIEFVQRYQISSIERFKGNQYQRACAVKRAISRIGEKAYNIVFNNCEHFKNWVLNGEDVSRQADTIGTKLALTGTGVYLLGMISESKRLKKAGALILITLLAIIIIAFIYWQNRQTINDEI